MLRTLAFAAFACAAPLAQADTLKIVALGDMPYGVPEKVYAPFEALIGAVNARQPDLVVHIGDTKSGGTPCSDQMLGDQFGYLNTFAAPTIYTPGDNEWTDCYRDKAGNFDPRERLDHIRKTYFADPETSFGARQTTLEHQGAKGYPENTYLMQGTVAVIAAHVVGSNNGFEIHDPAATTEFFARNKATIAWMEAGFAKATKANAEVVMVAIHADMFEFDFNTWGNERWLRHSGFAQFGPALQRAAKAFGKPVVLVYGDSHIFRVTRPFPKTAPNLTAVEVYGARDMHAVEITIETGGDAPSISVAPLLNPAL